MAHTLVSSLVLSLVVALGVRGETHTIKFENKCGFGTPTLIKGGDVLSTGEDYVHQGVFSSGIAYLQYDETCFFNGENCTTLEMSLQNPTAPGSGSSTDISLITPHAFSVTTGFSYFGGCDGAGTVCTSPTCKTAFFHPDDTWVQVACQENDVNLLITFCDDSTGSGGSPAPAVTTTPSPTPAKAAPTKAATTSSSTSTTSSSSAPSPSPAGPVVAVAPVPAAAPSGSSLVGTPINRPSCKKGTRRRSSRSDHHKRVASHKRHASGHH